MGFEIGKKVQSGDITLDQLTQKLQDVKLQQKAATIFEQFNTNRTANKSGEQVLDMTEQVALMSFFKEIAGGKKSDSKDTNLGRGDLRHFKKNHKGDNNAFSFIQDLGYGDMKKIMSAFTGVVEADDSDNQTIGSWEQKDGQVNKVTIGDKEYTINPDNTVSDAAGVTYEYKGGKLTKKEDGNTTTTFKNGVRAEETTTTQTGESKTTYRKDGNTIDQTVVSDPNTVTTTKYRDDGSTMASKKVEDKKTNTTTTTYYQLDGDTRAREEVVDNSNNKRTTTIFTPQGDFRSREIEEGNKITKIDYITKTQTITEGDDVETVETFVNYDNETGNISDNNISKRVVTNKKDHTRTTTEPSENQARTIELLDDNNSTVQRKVTFENGEAKITVGDKTITLETDKEGNILANARFLGTQMETVGDAAVRLGYAKGSPAYNAIVEKNGGANKRVAPGGNIKVPSDVASLRALKTETAVVDAKEQKRLYNQHQARVAAERAAKAELDGINTRIANASSRAAVLAKSIDTSGRGKVRQTYATANHKVYCAEGYWYGISDGSKNGKSVSTQAEALALKKDNWQQHYVYNPITDKMVPLESVMDGDLRGAHVKYITENGYAKLTDGRSIKINFSTFDNQMQRKVEKLQVNYNAAVAELQADAAQSRANMPNMKNVDGKEITKEVKTDSETQRPQRNVTVSEWNSNYTSTYETTGIKYASGNYISLEGGTATSLDADAILHMNGARYTIKLKDGTFVDTTVDYYNITGQRTTGQKSSQHMIGSDGYFNPHSSAFYYNSPEVYLDSHGTNANGSEFDGCPISSLRDQSGTWRVVIKKNNVYYDMNKLLEDGKKVVVRPGTFFEQG